MLECSEGSPVGELDVDGLSLGEELGSALGLSERLGAPEGFSDNEGLLLDIEGPLLGFPDRVGSPEGVIDCVGSTLGRGEGLLEGTLEVDGLPLGGELGKALGLPELLADDVGLELDIEGL